MWPSQFAPAQINNLLEMTIFVSLERQTWLFVAPVMRERKLLNTPHKLLLVFNNGPIKQYKPVVNNKTSGTVQWDVPYLQTPGLF